MAGGNFGPSTGGGRIESDNCEELSISTNITTPEENLFSELLEEQELNVKLTDQDRAVGLFTKENIFIGSVLDPKALKLIKCLKEGKKFIAIIKLIDEAYIDVYIYCKKTSELI